MGNSQTFIQRISLTNLRNLSKDLFRHFQVGTRFIFLQELTGINNPVAIRIGMNSNETLSVYVIFDSSSGMQYVGSTSGGNGIWSRWEGYARTGHNGNKALKSLQRRS